MFVKNLQHRSDRLEICACIRPCSGPRAQTVARPCWSREPESRRCWAAFSRRSRESASHETRAYVPNSLLIRRKDSFFLQNRNSDIYFLTLTTSVVRLNATTGLGLRLWGGGVASVADLLRELLMMTGARRHLVIKVLRDVHRGSTRMMVTVRICCCRVQMWLSDTSVAELVAHLATLKTFRRCHVHTFFLLNREKNLNLI